MAGGFPEGFALRPPTRSDGEAIVAMMNEESVALRGVAMVSLDWIVTPWTAPGADLERDFAVVTGPDGDLAGYVFVESHPPFTSVFSVGVVALRHHGRGVGAAVLEEAERRARRFVGLAPAGDRVVVHAGALADEPRVSGLLAAHGYVEVRRFARMAMEFDEPPEPPARLPGIDIRPLGARGGAGRVRLHLRGVRRSLGPDVAHRGGVAPRARRRPAPSSIPTSGSWPGTGASSPEP